MALSRLWKRPWINYISLDQPELREAKRAEALAQRQQQAVEAAAARAAKERAAALAQAQQAEERALVEFRHHAWQDGQAAKVDEARRHR